MKPTYKTRQPMISDGMLNNQKLYSERLLGEQDLTGAKLGLAAVMFLYVSLACFMPLIFIHFVQKRARHRESVQSEASNAVEQTINIHTTRPQTRWRAIWNRCTNCTSIMRDTFIGRSNCLAAGALLSVGFLDVFMDTIESFESALKKLQINSEFPMASFATLLGFLLILGVEQITLDYYHQPSHHNTSDEERNFSGVIIQRQDSQRMSIRLRAQSLTAVSEAVAIVPQTLDPCANNETTESAMCSTKGQSTAQGHSHFNSLTVSKSGWIRVTILLFAISLHSIFEGMALGLCETLTSVLTLFAALSLHKLLIAVSIGINLASETVTPNQTRQKRMLIFQSLAVLTFAGASPLGVLIGWAVTSRTESVEFLVSRAVLQGLACGTFCYVVFCELLPKELHEEKGDKAGKFFFLVLGFALVAFVIAFCPAE